MFCVLGKSGWLVEDEVDYGTSSIIFGISHCYVYDAHTDAHPWQIITQKHMSGWPQNGSVCIGNHSGIHLIEMISSGFIQQ